MKKIILGLAATALVAGAAIPVCADPMHGDYMHNDSTHNDRQHGNWGHDQGSNHQWNRGDRMGYNDWNGAQHVDYRQHGLRRPPRGYEWREENGQYILAAVATGLIASIILSNGR